MNGIRVGVAFEKLEYLEVLFLMKNDCTKKLNYVVAEMIKKLPVSCFSL